MRWRVELLVELKVPDVVALTARDSLQRRLNWAGRLTALTRADHWQLEVEAASQAEAEALARDLAERTTLFVNPNKHRYRVRVSPAQQIEASTERESGGPATRQVVGILTGFEEDATGDLTLQALQTRYGLGDQVKSVERGTWWGLELATGDAAQARRWAEEITVTRRREQGLLANPHSQWWRWAE